MCGEGEGGRVVRCGGHRAAAGIHIRRDVVAWNNSLTPLIYVLAGLYAFPGESYRIVTEAGIPPQFVAFRDKAIDTWYEILRAANTMGKVFNIVRISLNEHPTNSVSSGGILSCRCLQALVSICHVAPKKPNPCSYTRLSQG